MKRIIFNKLIDWKTLPNRKPLILQGARQIGKTWILKELGKTYKDGFIYINFDYQNTYSEYFKSKKPSEILKLLSIKLNKKITTDTLIILDEIQECPDALNSLKYFNEECNEYHVICAGSLLGLYLNSQGFPVGQVQFMNMEPMTFSEFLIAIGKEKYAELLELTSFKNELYKSFKRDLINLLKIYLIVGGMPATVEEYSKNQDFDRILETQQNIIDSFTKDFSKHTISSNVFKIGYIWDSLPSQLARVNKKFLYSAAKSGARAREYESSLMWLSKSNLVNIVYNVSKIGYPLSFYKDLTSFKIFVFDTGILSNLSKLTIKTVFDNDNLFEEFKGAITENYISQCLWYKNRDKPYYYSNVTKKQELDFLIMNNEKVIPIEVKAGKSKKATSMKAYLRENSEVLFGIRYSLNDLKLDGRILNIPLYLAEQTPKLISEALKLIK